jgi:serine phosphatase RsbU (regulator of sigma subunit)
MITHVSLGLTMLLGLSAVISLCTTIAFPNPDVSLGYGGTAVVAAAALAFGASFCLSRTSAFERGAWATIITIDAFLFGLGLLFEDRGAVLSVGFAVPVVCATIFLRARGTIAVFVLSGVIGTLYLAVAQVALVDAAFIIGIMFAVTALAVVVALLREGDLAHVKQLRKTERAQGERLRGELDLARRVQQAMLPDELPNIERLDLAAFSEPAFEASGDFYDVFMLDRADGEQPALGLVVCDVAGKGVASALVMAATRAAIRAVAERTHSLSAVLAKVNDTLAASLPPELFVTLCYAVFEPSTATLRWSSAGHPHPLRWTAEDHQVTELECYGMPLGLIRDSVYEEHSVRLEPGDVVMIFTDGLVEALDSSRSMYGFDRVERDFAEHACVNGSAAQKLHAVLTSMRVFIDGAQLEDDVTVVTLSIPQVVDLQSRVASAVSAQSAS